MSPEEQVVQEPATEIQSSQAPEDESTKTGRRRGQAMATVQSLLCTIVIVVFVVTFVVQAFRIPSESMERTLLTGDFLLVDKAHYGPGTSLESWLLPYRPIRRQDIVVFRYPVHPDQHFVKRVIGIPGDHIRIVRKRVYVNGVPLREDYALFNGNHDRYLDDFPNGPEWTLSMEPRWGIQKNKLVEDGQLIVPEDSLFVMGDNRDDSSDSRIWGFVPRQNVIGRPLLIYWSMDMDGWSDPLSRGSDDRLSSLMYFVGHLFQNVRWSRVLRLVK